MYGTIATVAFVGVEARPVEVQVRISPGQQAFAIVGLPDKAVAESRERVRNALHAVGLGLPYKHITVNLAPADLPKEGSHFDLAIVLALMRTNAECAGHLLEKIAQPDDAGLALIRQAAETLKLSARGFHRTLRVARTLADLDGADVVGRIHVAEALSYRGETLRQETGATGRRQLAAGT